MLIETQYLPSLEFFCAIQKVDEIQIEVCEHFVKQSYRNHALIKAANGVEKLIVPLTAKGNRVVMKDVRIDVSQNWQNNQWRTIESAYRKSPYYEHYADDLRKVLFKDHTYLVELNFELLSVMFRWLGWSKKITPTQTYQTELTKVIDLRNILLSKKPYTERNFYKSVPYTQVFGETFVENLSLVDLIFCCGPQAPAIIRASSLNL